MSSAKKMLLSAAGVGGAGLDIAEVFSTYLYTGDGSNGTAIVNGIDLSGEGGLVWRKKRAGSGTVPDHTWVDTERGRTKFVFSNSTAAEVTSSNSITSFNNNGFTIVDNNSYGQNLSSETYASWTFRKAEKFFDIVTYTGNGVHFREIPHNLGSTPGLIMIKCLNSVESWMVYHKDLAEDTGTTPSSAYSLSLNGTSAASTLTRFQYSQSDTVFKLAYQSSQTNANNNTYVAYLFAHNNNDGEFGPDSDQDIIKCGSYTGNGSTNGPVVTLGWEPQWLMYKNTNGTDSWQMVDTMRGMPFDSNTMRILKPNTTALEASNNPVAPTATGFQVKNAGGGNNDNGSTYVYMAIRAPMITPPKAATDVFLATAAASFNAFDVGFTTDLYTAAIRGGNSLNFLTSDRLRGDTKYLSTSMNAAEGTDSGGAANFDLQNSFDQGYSSSAQIRYNFKRAKNYIDVVAYNGNGTAGRTVAHSLGVAPEMMWVKRRSGVDNWTVYAGDATDVLRLNTSDATADASIGWNDTAPTASVFTVGSHNLVNGSGQTYIAYLFATLAGVSKVGSVSHSGSSTDVNCGFSNGARFVMLKRTDAAGDWYVWDSVRGIIAGNDPYLLLNLAPAEVTNTDYIDPLSSGFTITGDFADGDYIFYAIA